MSTTTTNEEYWRKHHLDMVEDVMEAMSGAPHDTSALQHDDGEPVIAAVPVLDLLQRGTWHWLPLANNRMLCYGFAYTDSAPAAGGP